MKIREFTIKNFRCFSDFEIKNFSNINLISGINNVGKTSFLESLFVHAGKYNPRLLLSINAFRGINAFEISSRGEHLPWDNVYFNLDPSKTIELTSVDSNNNKHTNFISNIQDTEMNNLIKRFPDLSKVSKESISKYQIQTPPTFPGISFQYMKNNNLRESYYLIFDDNEFTQYPYPKSSKEPVYFQFYGAPDESQKLFSNLEEVKKEQFIIDALKIFDNRIMNIHNRIIGKEVLLYVDIGLEKTFPIHLMGKGIHNALLILLKIANSPKGIALIDEVENGIHFSILEKFWKVINEFSKEFNTQIFATTHSYECISAAQKAFIKSVNDREFSYFRFDKVDNNIISTRYNIETLTNALDLEFEVR
jgi:AAA15 family ATPase/GTPase